MRLAAAAPRLEIGDIIISKWAADHRSGGNHMGHLKSSFLAASLFCVASAQADELIRKGGEWQTTTTGVRPQRQTMAMCFAAAEQAMARFATRPNCTKTDAAVSGSVATLDVAYTSDLTMHMGAKVIHSLSDAKWTGDCKPGEILR
jgi:hypothetical protein